MGRHGASDMSSYASVSLTVTTHHVASCSESHGSLVMSMSGNRYLMHGTVSGSRVQWIVSGRPDITGAFYSGATPTSIVVAAGPF